MAIELKEKQWYRCRNGWLAYVLGIAPQCSQYVVAFYRKSELHVYSQRSASGEERLGEEKNLDLVEHLPDCTGPNWFEPVWRDAKQSDLSDGPTGARFRDSEYGTWRVGTLIGWEWRDGRMIWLDGCDWWFEAQVLDKPAHAANSSAGVKS